VAKIKNFIKRFKNKAEEISDFTSDAAAQPWFIITHLIWWMCWIGFGVEAFPYGLLTLIVSLEAIVLSGLLLSSGNREGDIEKKIARKDLRISTETNLMVEEMYEIVRDLQEDIRLIKEDVGDDENPRDN
jgi:uncharacterized membrane protein